MSEGTGLRQHHRCFAEARENLTRRPAIFRFRAVPSVWAAAWIQPPDPRTRTLIGEPPTWWDVRVPLIDRQLFVVVGNDGRRLTIEDLCFSGGAMGRALRNLFETCGTPGTPELEAMRKRSDALVYQVEGPDFFQCFEKVFSHEEFRRQLDNRSI